MWLADNSNESEIKQVVWSWQWCFTIFQTKAWFPLVLRIARIGDFYDIPTSGILTTSGNTSSQKSQTVDDFYDVIGRIGIISTLKILSQTSMTSAIFTMSVNLAVLRIAIVARIPVSGNRKNPRFLRFLGQVGTRLKQLPNKASDIQICWNSYKIHGLRSIAQLSFP